MDEHEEDVFRKSIERVLKERGTNIGLGVYMQQVYMPHFGKPDMLAKIQEQMNRELGTSYDIDTINRCLDIAGLYIPPLQGIEEKVAPMQIIQEALAPKAPPPKGEIHKNKRKPSDKPTGRKIDYATFITGPREDPLLGGMQGGTRKQNKRSD